MMGMMAKLVGGWRMYLMMAVIFGATITTVYLRGRSDGANECKARYAEATIKQQEAVLKRLDEIDQENAKSRAEQAIRDAEILDRIEQSDETFQKDIGEISANRPVVITRSDCDDFRIDYDSSVGVLNDIAERTRTDNRTED